VAVSLAPVPLAEKAALRAMFDPYLIAHADLADPGRIHGDPLDQPYFDLYWAEPERAPFWIVSDGERAGFALLNAWSPSGRGVDRAIAEFCVIPQRRRDGIGRAAALCAFATAPGVWELQVYRANPAGMAFWPRAIEAAAPSEWEEIAGEDRVIHRFVLPRDEFRERA
jgi:predicted acetyltransferase